MTPLVISFLLMTVLTGTLVVTYLLLALLECSLVISSRD